MRWFFLSLSFILPISAQSIHQKSPLSGHLERLTLTGLSNWNTSGEKNIHLSQQSHRSIDGASLLDNSPGVAIVRNGSQTGIVQMRGLTGNRVKVLINDMSISPACPNHMDPPMHYASSGNKTILSLFSGVTPVRYGGDSLAGTVRLAHPKPSFTEVGKVETSGELSAQHFGSYDGYGSGAEFELSSQRAVLSYRGGWSKAGDLRYPGGRVRASGYESSLHHEIDAAFRTSNGDFSVDAGQSRTRDSGTPVLPMDMIEADSWHAGFRYVANLENAKWVSRFYVHSIDHLMDNYSLRNNPMMLMEAPSESEDYGLQSSVEIPVESQVLRLGFNWHRNDFNAVQKQVMTGKTRDMFADNKRESLGVFAEWEQEWSEQWSGLFGLRADYIKTSAGKVNSQFGAVDADALKFNTGARSHDDVMVDIATTLVFTPNEKDRYSMSLGIKNRAPSLLERYLWTPLSSSAGRADGRTYLGNTELKPEMSFQFTGSISHREESWEISFAPFYHRVNDYIQGAPMSRNDRNGNPVLQFQNINQVSLYGAELSGNYQISKQFKIAAQLSYVRGKNHDADDSLYRIAPLHGLVDLAWGKDIWDVHLELDWAAAQDDVSAYNNERESAGYALVHLRGGCQLNESTRIELGVENCLDKEYSPHLAGVNRVSGSDVAVGENIPGAGRFFYANLTWAF